VLPPRDKEQAEDLILWAESYYSNAFRGFDEDDEFYEGLFVDQIPVPDGFTVTIPTTGRAIVDEAVDAIAPQDFLVVYPPRGLTHTAETDADSNRRFVHNSLQYIRRASADIDPIRDFIRNLFRSGKACFKVVPDYTLYPVLDDAALDELEKETGDEYEANLDQIREMRAENFPFIVRSLPPQCIMEDPTVSARKLWVIERYELSTSEVQSHYSQEIEEFRLHNRMWWNDGYYKVHEIWTAPYRDHRGKLIKGKHFIFLNYEMVSENDHELTRLPYVIKYSGFGREAYQGKPELKSVGFYTAQTKSMILAEARRATSFDALMSQFAYPLVFLPEQLDTPDLSLEPGAVNFVTDQVMEKLGAMFVKPPVLAPEYLSSLNWLNQQIERGSVSRSVRGAPLPGADSAAQYSLQSNSANRRLDSCKEASEFGVAEVGSLFLMYTDKHLKDKVSVFSAGNEERNKYTVSPETIKGNYVVNVTFVPNEDAVKERKLILANDAIAKGGLSPYDALVYAGFDNASELVARRLAWDVMMSDAVKGYLGRELLLEWGLDADALEIEGRMKDMQKQQALREVANQAQLGTGAGDPEAQGPGGPPQQPPEMQQMPMGNPNGAPQQVMPPQVAGAVADLNAMGGSITP
jgi:hypothetical protein